MKLIYIGKNEFSNKYKSLYKSFAIESIHYTNPLKAADNLVEINPDILYINKNDFPRLWKIILTSVRELYDDKHCSFILEGSLDDEELKAFNYLKGSFFIENPDNQIHQIKKHIIDITGYTNLSKSFYPVDGDLCISFVNPEDFSFVSGNILELNENLLVFRLENSDDIEGIEVDSILSDVSINLKNDVVTVDVKIVSIAKNIVCQIIKGQKEYTNLTNSLFV